MELEQVAKAGESLLNFEQSIEKELEAELLLGKQLNLERARLAALTGDYETLTREINKNVGDFSDFTKLNVLQQKALASAVGLTVDELSDQLLQKENLTHKFYSTNQLIKYINKFLYKNFNYSKKIAKLKKIGSNILSQNLKEINSFL